MTVEHDPFLMPSQRGVFLERLYGGDVGEMTIDDLERLRSFLMFLFLNKFHYVSFSSREVGVLALRPEVLVARNQG